MLKAPCAFSTEWWGFYGELFDDGLVKPRRLEGWSLEALLKIAWRPGDVTFVRILDLDRCVISKRIVFNPS